MRQSSGFEYQKDHWDVGASGLDWTVHFGIGVDEISGCFVEASDLYWRVIFLVSKGLDGQVW